MKKLWIAILAICLLAGIAFYVDNHFDNKAATEVEDVQKGN
jgi:hypothetical protein